MSLPRRRRWRILRFLSSEPRGFPRPLVGLELLAGTVSNLGIGGNIGTCHFVFDAEPFGLPWVAAASLTGTEACFESDDPAEPGATQARLCQGESFGSSTSQSLTREEYVELL